jgi:hypothetical protein
MRPVASDVAPGLGSALLALGLRVRTPDKQRAGDHPQHNPDRGAAGSGRLLQGGAQWAPCTNSVRGHSLLLLHVVCTYVRSAQLAVLGSFATTYVIDDQ